MRGEARRRKAGKAQQEARGKARQGVFCPVLVCPVRQFSFCSDTVRTQFFKELHAKEPDASVHAKVGKLGKRSCTESASLQKIEWFPSKHPTKNDGTCHTSDLPPVLQQREKESERREQEVYTDSKQSLQPSRPHECERITKAARSSWTNRCSYSRQACEP